MARERQHISHPVVSTTPKTAVVATILAGLLGPFGLFYATVSGAMIMLVVAIILATFTWGIGVFLVWPLCAVWAWRATIDYNKKHVDNDNHRRAPDTGP